MKVVFNFYGPNGLGGPATWVRRMLPRLKGRGIDVVAMPYHTAEGECAVVDDLRRAGVPVHEVRAAGQPTGEGVRLLLAALAEEKPAVIVADHVLPAFVAGSWVRSHGVPTVMVLRSDDTWYAQLRAMFVSGGAERRVAAVVAVSQELELAVRAEAPVEVRVLRCPSGTPIPEGRARWRRDEFHAVYLGRFDEEQKRIRELVRELIRTSQALPRFSATLYGDGPLRGEIEKTLRLECGHRVAYGGRLAVDEVPARLQAAQALVSLSAFEGLSSAVQEAMAAGLPVIARRTQSGTEGVLVHGETGWVLETDGELETAVRRLLDSESEWRRMADGARELAEREFDLEKAADRWAELLTTLGDGRAWPVCVAPAAVDAEVVYFDYLRAKPIQELSEGVLLGELGRCGGLIALERFLETAEHSWDERRFVLHHAAAKGLLAVDRAETFARKLAEEAEASGEMAEAVRYRIASLWQLAGDSARARDGFHMLGAAAQDRGLRAGSYFHLAEIARSEGHRAEALAHATACLTFAPDHRAAALLCRQIDFP